MTILRETQKCFSCLKLANIGHLQYRNCSEGLAARSHDKILTEEQLSLTGKKYTLNGEITLS